MINGISYAWADMKFTFLGREVVGITAVSWTKKHDKTNNYGAGDEVISRGHGKKEYDANITLECKEVVGILDALEEGEDLTDIAPFELSISFLNDSNKKVDVTIHNVEFLESGLDAKSGDTSIEIELPLIISGITFKK